MPSLLFERSDTRWTVGGQSSLRFDSLLNGGDHFVTESHCNALQRYDSLYCTTPLLKMHLRKTIAGVFPLLSQKPKVAIPKSSFFVVGHEFGFWGCFSFSNGGLVGVSNGHKALTHVCRWTVIVQQSVHIIHFYILIILYIMLYASHSSAVIISQARDLVCKGAKANMSAVSMYKALALDLL